MIASEKLQIHNNDSNKQQEDMLTRRLGHKRCIPIELFHHHQVLQLDQPLSADALFPHLQ